MKVAENSQLTLLASRLELGKLNDSVLEKREGGSGKKSRATEAIQRAGVAGMLQGLRSAPSKRNV